MAATRAGVLGACLLMGAAGAAVFVPAGPAGAQDSGCVAKVNGTSSELDVPGPDASYAGIAVGADGVKVLNISIAGWPGRLGTSGLPAGTSLEFFGNGPYPARRPFKVKLTTSGRVLGKSFTAYVINATQTGYFPALTCPFQTSTPTPVTPGPVTPPALTPPTETVSSSSDLEPLWWGLTGLGLVLIISFFLCHTGKYGKDDGPEVDGGGSDDGSDDCCDCNWDWLPWVGSRSSDEPELIATPIVDGGGSSDAGDDDGGCDCSWFGRHKVVTGLGIVALGAMTFGATQLLGSDNTNTTTSNEKTPSVAVPHVTDGTHYFAGTTFTRAVKNPTTATLLGMTLNEGPTELKTAGDVWKSTPTMSQSFTLHTFKGGFGARYVTDGFDAAANTPLVSGRVSQLNAEVFWFRSEADAAAVAADFQTYLKENRGPQIGSTILQGPLPGGGTQTAIGGRGISVHYVIKLEGSAVVVLSDIVKPGVDDGKTLSQALGAFTGEKPTFQLQQTLNTTIRALPR